ncbi:hypothetical protein FACS1894105_10410 [Clostridia bacterium]|nr:hypothetical protein FACS1894105_10410 [Clostridia bacterium]GHV14929.1 hypothetical protein FACS1894219_11500 [Clostridia bacterium]
MSGKLKIGVIGCGGISGWHLGRTKDFEDIEFVGFHDIVKSKAEAMVNIVKQGKAYDSAVELYDQGKPDAIYICVPPDQHGAIELEAVKRGIHFLVQKPIALDVAVAERICDLATQYNIITSVGHQDRYLEVVEETQKFLADREVALVNAAWVGGIPGVYWWRRRTTAGGQVVEQNIHHFDILRYILGSEPVTVYTASGKGIVKPNKVKLPGYDVEDYSATTVTFRNGTVANIFTGDYVEKGGMDFAGATFYAKDGTADYKLRNKVTLTDKTGTKEIINSNKFEYNLDRTFIDAVKSGAPEDIEKIRSPYYDGIKSLKFALATNKSIDTGNAVYVNL